MSTPLRDGAAAAGTGIPPVRTTAVRTTADPVKALLHRHRELCVQAVDPLEIAAALEAEGIAEHEAAHCRHRDVFSLSEELYARVRRAEPAAGRQDSGLQDGGWQDGEGHGEGQDGDGSAEFDGAPPVYASHDAARWTAGRLATLWLVAYALLGDPLLAALLNGRPPGTLDLPHALSAAVPTALALACAVVPAGWCARWYAERVRHALAGSRTLGEFRTRAWPALLAATGLDLGALLALLWVLHTALDTVLAPRPPADPVTPIAAATALGGLLFLARITAARGRTRAAAAAVSAACAAEAAALLGAWLGEGVEAPFHGPAVVPLVACAAPALALLIHALPALSRASAHRYGAHATALDLIHPAAAGPDHRAPAGRPHPEPHTPSEEQGR
ncbi:hypothetical protein CTZ27_15605 [Streptomyces griseocarneus]|nr:hypothetical protein CTZ27_15605 [Streptomyces griseocarneus]